MNGVKNAYNKLKDNWNTAVLPLYDMDINGRYGGYEPFSQACINTYTTRGLNSGDFSESERLLSEKIETLSAELEANTLLNNIKDVVRYLNEEFVKILEKSSSDSDYYVNLAKKYVKKGMTVDKVKKWSSFLKGEATRKINAKVKMLKRVGGAAATESTDLSDGVFSTARPTVSMEDKLEQLVNLKRNRQRNLEALLESTSSSADEKDLEKKLNDITKNNDLGAGDVTDALNSSKLEKTKKDVVTERLAFSKLGLRDRLMTEGIQKCWDDAMFQIVYEGFWIDEELKESMRQDMLESYQDIKQMLHQVGVTETRDSNYFLQNLNDIVMETCKKACDRILKEGEDEGDGILDTNDPEELNRISFSLNDDEAISLSSNLSELGADQLSDLVKQKVVQVINDEKEYGEKKATILNELKDATKDPEDLGGEGDTTDPDSTGEDIAKESVTLESLTQLKRTRDSNKNAGGSLFECLMMKSTKETEEVIATEGVEVPWEQKMDMTFASAVLEYTILETLNTVGLYDFSHASVRSIENYCKNISK